MVFAIHWHESAMDLHVFPIPIPPHTSLSTRSLWVFPVLQPWALVSCIQPGLVICFTLDSILVSMLFSQNIPPSSSPRVPKSVLYICVSFSVLHIGLSLPSFKIPHICVSILYWSLSLWLTSLCIMGSSFFDGVFKVFSIWHHDICKQVLLPPFQCRCLLFLFLA